ncbi:hypothetical protein DVJ78_18330 (plasmid) [Humibacter sp. BT305]|nr:hypothetical protein DVJ78_18330 [Humibacter sp. BT305]
MLRVIIPLAVLLLIATAAVWGAGTLLGQLVSRDPDTGTTCSRLTDQCTDLPLATIEHQTGYTFPAGTEVLASTMGAGTFLDGSDYRVLTARLRLPAGSALPTSNDPQSHISVLSTEDDGSILIGVRTDNGKSMN